MSIILTESEIENVYKNFILPKSNKEYLERYKILPPNPNKNWDWRRKDMPRIFAVLEFKKFIDDNNLFFDKVLTLNGGGDPEYEHLKYNKNINYNYTDDKLNYDLHNLNLPEKDFDFFMTNQTLEHVYDPVKVVQNIYKHMKENGIVYMNLPAVNIPHSTPFHHFTGITPVGLGCIFKSAGFKILDIGFWGNSSYHNFIFNRYHHPKWPDYTQVTDYTSNFERPVITWIFAKKTKND
jgi:SAM-dependent methyltransferase